MLNKYALEGVKVLDFGWALVGSLTGRHLANQGAQVIRIESMKRLDLSRTNKHISLSQPNNPDDKPWYVYLNTSKMSMTLDLKHPKAKYVIDKLIKWADVVNENFTPGTLNKLGYGYEYIKSIKPDIVMLSSSVFGQTGPLANEWGLDLVGNAWSGRNSLAGWPDREPAKPSTVAYGDDLLPFFNVMAIVAALDYKRRTGKGQYIDSSMMEICAQQITPAFLDWQINSNLQTRTGNRIANASPHGVFPCTGDDRWCALGIFSEQEWQAFCRVLGNSSWTKNPKFASFEARKQNEDELERLIAEWTITRSAEQIMGTMQKAGVPCGIVQTAEDIMEFDPQLKKRKFIIPLKHPILETFRHPSTPVKLSKTKAKISTGPCLGEHTEYICTKFLGISDSKFIEMYQDGVFK